VPSIKEENEKILHIFYNHHLNEYNIEEKGYRHWENIIIHRTIKLFQSSKGQLLKPSKGKSRKAIDEQILNSKMTTTMACHIKIEQ